MKEIFFHSTSWTLHVYGIYHGNCIMKFEQKIKLLEFSMNLSSSTNRCQVHTIKSTVNRVNGSMAEHFEIAIMAEFAFCGDKQLFILGDIFLNVLTELIHIRCFFPDLPCECLNIG